MKTISGFFVKKKSNIQYEEVKKFQYLLAKDDIKSSSEVLELTMSRISNKNLENIKNFLNPKIKNILPNPFILKDMRNACKKILEVILLKQKICIFGDYDVDGATSTALMISYLSEFGVDIEFYIPNRISEGYGLNNKAVEILYEKGVNLIITVDCGIVSFEAISLAKHFGIDVIVLDHHVSETRLPDAFAIVNPNRLDEICSEELKKICACAISFLCIVGLNILIKEEKLSFPNINLMNFIPLVGLATVCDVMPLNNINRTFVYSALKILNTSNENIISHKAIKKMCEISGINLPITAFHFGFSLGPMINAAGRIGDSSIGTVLLSSNNDNLQKILAEKLYFLNKERQELEKNIINNLKENSDLALKVEKNGFFFAYDNTWHEGLVGIIASRMKDLYNRPAIVGSINGEEIKCSARSIGEIHIGNIILKGIKKGLINKGGGHKAAAGFSFDISKINYVIEFLQIEIKELSDIEFENKSIEYDLEISSSAINIPFIEAFCILEPYGMSNPSPLFLIKNIKIIKTFTLKNRHIRFLFSGDSEISYWGICFNCVDKDLGLSLISGNICSLLVTIHVSFFNNEKKIDIIVKDIISHH